MTAAPAASVADLVALLETGAAVDLGPPDGPRHTQLDHALQTAALLSATRPDDPALVAAGLVHDIGHLLWPHRDEVHADVGADHVAPVLGPRVAALVRLHVAAKRFAVATDPAYAALLAPDSVASLAVQGGPMSPAEVVTFGADPHAAAALALRRADEGAKVAGRVVAPLATWVPLLHRVAGGP